MKHCFAALIAAVLMVSCAQEEINMTVQDQPSTDLTAVSDAYVPGESYVYFSEEMTAMIEEHAAAGDVRTKSAELNEVLDVLGITEMRRLFPHAGEFEPRTRKEGLHRWYIVRYSESIPHTKAEDDFMNVPGVDFIEPVRQIKLNDFNDLDSQLWGLNNTSVPGVDINVMPVWDNYTTGNPDVIVSVVDEGVDLSHEDLAANCLASGHYNSVDNNSIITGGHHGTHVAGTIAAVSNNGKGVAGIAGGDYANGIPGVKIMSCQIFKETSNGTVGGSSAAAIKWGADNGAVISQNSWGYNADTNLDGKLSTEEIENAKKLKVSSADKQAIDYFIKYAGCDNNGNQLPGSPMKGGVVIFAAGNDAITNSAPGNYSEVIAVGSVTSDGTRSSFSNYGDWVDIAAPGTGIYSTVVGNSYGTMNGTSMACPHVSGIAALLVSYFGGPGFTNEMLKERIIESANKALLSPAYQIGGLADAYGAFVYGNDKAPSDISDMKVAGRGNSLDLTFTVPADEDGKPAYGLMVLYSTDKDAVTAADPDNYSSVKYKTFVLDASAGETVTCTVEELDFETVYHVKAYAYSYGRNYSSATSTEEVSTTKNNPPVIKSLYEGSYTIMSSETLTVPIQIVDPDGHSVTVTITNGSPAETFMMNPDGNWRLTLKGNGAEQGTYTAVIRAVDTYGLSAEMEVVYTIKENSAPVKIKDIDNVLLTAKGQEFTMDMTEFVNDPDGEQLKFDISISDNKVLHIVAKGNQLLGTALGYGTSDVQVTAKDARGESVSLAFKVQVKDPSKPVSVYPNPVTDFVNVGTLEPADTRIRIVSQTGQTVYDKTSVVSGYDPARIDMTSCPPGNYVVAVSFGGEEYRQNIVKL